jgi:hypothetical protein
VTAFIPETVNLGALAGAGYDAAGNVDAGYTKGGSPANGTESLRFE